MHHNITGARVCVCDTVCAWFKDAAKRQAFPRCQWHDHQNQILVLIAYTSCLRTFCFIDLCQKVRIVDSGGFVMLGQFFRL